jgi:hypothetical protein
VLHVRCGGERSGSARPHHAAALDQDMTVSNADQRVDILIDDQNGKSRRLQSRES